MTAWIGSPASLVLHTLFFLGAFASVFLGVPMDEMLLVLTTIVSLEAIYLAIFIQMSVNRASQSLAEVEEDIGEIREDVEEVTEGVGDIQEDVAELGKDVEEIQEDIGEIQEDEAADDAALATHADRLAVIQSSLQQIVSELDNLKKERLPK